MGWWVSVRMCLTTVPVDAGPRPAALVRSGPAPAWRSSTRPGAADIMPSVFSSASKASCTWTVMPATTRWQHPAMAIRPRRSINCCPGPFRQSQAESQVAPTHRLPLTRLISSNFRKLGRYFVRLRIAFSMIRCIEPILRYHERRN